jgi:oxygen-independent coproporphyrinogen-3 oxidase
MDDGIGLYVHIPFCETKCPYCDFNTYSGIEKLLPAYVEALNREIACWGNLLEKPQLVTVFFGGGTPSYAPAGDLASLMAVAGAAFRLRDGAEITLEANPGDVTAEKAAAWLDAGFNRVSMGVQSFDDGLLELLGRRHTAGEAVGAFTTLRSAGFQNCSIDLMFGLPYQSLRQWSDSLDGALALEPEHISLYGLQLEHGTPLEAAVRTGRTQRPDDDLAADMYQLAEERLAAAGYRHYEISNWARPGLESRHNLLYWQCRPYLGVGPGAHSSLLGHRFADMRSPRGYVRAMGVMAPESSFPGLDLTEVGRPDKPAPADVAASAPPPIRQMVDSGPVAFVEETTPQLALAETMMMGLRLDTGVSDSEVRQQFGAGLRDLFGEVIDSLKAANLLREDEVGIRLSERGRLLGNEVFQRFVTAAESA